MTAKGPTRVLLVDDDPNFSRLVERKLQKEMYEVNCTSSIKDFFNKVKLRSRDILLVDLNLKEGALKGFQVVEALRKEVSYRGHIIIISRENEQEKIAHAIELGADDYITKPLNVELLNYKIQNLLENELYNTKVSNLVKVPAPLRPSQIEMDFTLHSISEEGVWVKSRNSVAKGVKLELESRTLKEIFGVNSLKLMVARAIKESNGMCYLFLEFNPADELGRKKVHDWIEQKHGKVDK